MELVYSMVLVGGEMQQVSICMVLDPRQDVVSMHIVSYTMLNVLFKNLTWLLIIFTRPILSGTKNLKSPAINTELRGLLRMLSVHVKTLCHSFHKKQARSNLKILLANNSYVVICVWVWVLLWVASSVLTVCVTVYLYFNCVSLWLLISQWIQVYAIVLVRIFVNLRLLVSDMLKCTSQIAQTHVHHEKVSHMFFDFKWPITDPSNTSATAWLLSIFSGLARGGARGTIFLFAIRPPGKGTPKYYVKSWCRPIVIITLTYANCFRESVERELVAANEAWSMFNLEGPQAPLNTVVNHLRPSQKLFQFIANVICRVEFLANIQHRINSAKILSSSVMYR